MLFTPHNFIAFLSGHFQNGNRAFWGFCISVVVRMVKLAISPDKSDCVSMDGLAVLWQYVVNLKEGFDS